MANDNPFGAPAAVDDDFSVELGVDEGFRIIAGKYSAKVIGLEKTVSKAGNPMWVWSFVLMAGQYAGREFKTYTVLSASAMWKMREVLVALGLGQEGKQSQFKRADAIGKKCTLVIQDSEYNGTKSSEVEKVTPFDEKLLKEAGGEKITASQASDVP